MVAVDNAQLRIVRLIVEQALEQEGGLEGKAEPIAISRNEVERYSEFLVEVGINETRVVQAVPFDLIELAVLFEKGWLRAGR